MAQTFPSRFLDPAAVLMGAQLKPGDRFVDFGCGNGFYAVPAAKLVGSEGTVIAVDILDDALEATASAAQFHNLRNIKLLRCDLESPLACKIPPGSCDMALAANIMHQAKAKEEIVAAAYRCLKTGGRFIVVDWDKAPRAPFGPPVPDRLSRRDMTEMAEHVGMRFLYEVPTDEYHYGLVFIK
jgi:ubiquinone/menaquinone biosynthesis C-methylase UbiE